MNYRVFSMSIESISRAKKRSISLSVNARFAGAVLHTFAALALVMIAGPSRAEPYRLDRGDLLGITVFGISDFNRNATVNVDGDISLPLVGHLRAAGRTLPELQSQIRDLLAGRDAVRKAEVTVELIQHRPFYITGDVTTPGAQPWRPDLTVRHAVALAGGYSIMRGRNLDTPHSAAELSGRYHALMVEYVRLEARLSGLQAELHNKGTIDFERLERVIVPAELLERIKELEARNLAERRTNFDNEKKHLSDLIVLSDSQIKTLEQGRVQDQINVAQQLEALARASSLQSRALATLTRVSDEQRALAFIKSRELDTLARLGRARQDRQEQGRKLERADDEHRQYLTRAVQDGMVEAEKTLSELRGIGERLLLTGAIGSQLSGLGSKAEAAIYRKAGEDALQKLIATQDTSVEPGDIVELTIRFDPQLLSSRARSQ